MSTAAERVAIDVMLAALDGCTKNQDAPRALTKKIGMLLGMSVMLAKERGVTLSLLKEFLADRWSDYGEHFDDAGPNSQKK